MLKYYNDYFTLILNNPTLIFLNNKMFSFVLHTGVKVASIAKKMYPALAGYFPFLAILSSWPDRGIKERIFEFLFTFNFESFNEFKIKSWWNVNYYNCLLHVRYKEQPNLNICDGCNGN